MSLAPTGLPALNSRIVSVEKIASFFCINKIATETKKDKKREKERKVWSVFNSNIYTSVSMNGC